MAQGNLKLSEGYPCLPPCVESPDRTTKSKGLEHPRVLGVLVVAFKASLWVSETRLEASGKAWVACADGHISQVKLRLEGADGKSSFLRIGFWEWFGAAFFLDLGTAGYSSEVPMPTPLRTGARPL